MAPFHVLYWSVYFMSILMKQEESLHSCVSFASGRATLKMHRIDLRQFTLIWIHVLVLIIYIYIYICVLYIYIYLHIFGIFHWEALFLIWGSFQDESVLDLLYLENPSMKPYSRSSLFSTYPLIRYTLWTPETHLETKKWQVNLRPPDATSPSKNALLRAY